jgi:predicted metal-dependent hydrolase
MPSTQQLTLFGADALEQSRETDPSRRLVQLGARVIAFRFTRSRRRTIGISIDAQGLAVAAPYYAPWAEIEKFLREKSRWILKKLDEWAKAGRPVHVMGVPGESIPVRGRTLTLEIAKGAKRLEMAGDKLMLRLRKPQERGHVKTELVRGLKLHALEVLAPRVAYYTAQLRLPQPKVALSNARTQWGVCTQDGRIRLSWRLVHVPPALADYVVAHEVAHLVELNHSSRFWKVVESLYPDCRAARQRLDLAAAALPVF